MRDIRGAGKARGRSAGDREAASPARGAWSLGLSLPIAALLLAGCSVLGFIFMPEAEDADIQAGFRALAQAAAHAQAGKTIVTEVPSTTTYASDDGTVTLVVELREGVDSPFATSINTYTLANFKDPNSDLVVTKASFTVRNDTDSYGDSRKQETGSADFSSAKTLQRLDFDIWGKYPAWGPDIDYEFQWSTIYKANYKEISYLRVEMIP